MIIGKAKVCVTFIFRKIEGYTPSGLGSRSLTVDRLAWLAGLAGRRKSIVFQNF